MFQKYRKNIFSQNGEDGVILEILKRLKLKSKNSWCCEFGAWDGIHGSNTFNLVKNFNYNAVYIEGDQKKYNDLILTQSKYSKIIPIKRYISHKIRSSDSLDNILKKTSIKKNFEILSIDIDSYDLAVWKSIKKYRPIIVIIEINSGIEPGIHQIHSQKRRGNSFTSTVNFATKINYQLLCHTGNCIFIDKKYLNKLNINKRFLNNKEAHLLFDYSWKLKKVSKFKKILKIILPNKVISYLRNTKNKLIINLKL